MSAVTLCYPRVTLLVESVERVTPWLRAHGAAVDREPHGIEIGRTATVHRWELPEEALA